MKFGYTVTIAVAIWAGATGCSRTMTVNQHRAMVEGMIEIGMTRIEVERKLGFPQRIERVGTMTFLFYSPAYYISVFWTSSHNPIAIEDDKIVGIGKAYYDRATAGAPRG